MLKPVPCPTKPASCGNCFRAVCISRLQILVLTRKSHDLGACSTRRRSLPKLRPGCASPARRGSRGCAVQSSSKKPPPSLAASWTSSRSPWLVHPIAAASAVFPVRSVTLGEAFRCWQLFEIGTYGEHKAGEAVPGQWGGIPGEKSIFLQNASEKMDFCMSGAHRVLRCRGSAGGVPKARVGVRRQLSRVT